MAIIPFSERRPGVINGRLTALLMFLAFQVSAQKNLAQDKALEEAIVRSGILHSPLPLDTDRSFEAGGLTKKISRRSPLTVSEGLGKWTHSGLGSLNFSREHTLSGGGSLKMSFPTSSGKRAVGSPSDPDYATYGYCEIRKDAGGENWQDFNRIEFSIYPDCEGARVTGLDFFFENADTPRLPGTNRRSASHWINLKNREWNRIVLELEEFQRDRVLNIGFRSAIRGKDRTTGDLSVFYIDGIELQRVEEPDPVSGWVPQQGRIIYSTSGYESGQAKTAIARADENGAVQAFHLVEAVSGKVVYKAAPRMEKTSLGRFTLLDFSDFNKEGSYSLKWGDAVTPPFRIGSRIWENSIWRVLNYIFCQRCGYPVPGKHGTCHLDLFSAHDGRKISYAGGWHDAGDLSQQTLQTADVTHALLELYGTLKGKNDYLAGRLLEEAQWGLEFVLRNRYGDGYRSSSVGLLIWQDGILGTLDDISTVRVQNLAFDNFLYAAYEAYAALTIDQDPMLQEYLEKVAIEDFAFALQRHAEKGYGEFIYPYEHSYNTSESQYRATISWGAGMLYRLTGETFYADLAAEHIRYTLDCQQTEPLTKESDMRGFFYRDTTKRAIVHYNHQSREQVYMQALVLLCETQPQHPDRRRWEEAIRLYGGYLKKLMPYTAPYGMLPSGVYHMEEYKDTTGFQRLHLFAPDNATELYREQVSRGEALGNDYFVRRFPVWFGIFNGNTAVHLTMGKAAAVCGRFLGDNELLQIGRRQMEWVAGKNPFGQSLIYGEGYNYPQMNSFSSGEITGEIPVGIRSLDNEDIPYWPQVNNACYKEVWVTSAGKWLSLQAEY